MRERDGLTDCERSPGRGPNVRTEREWIQKKKNFHCEKKLNIFFNTFKP